MTKKALLHVSDTSGLAAFAKSLIEDSGYALLAQEETAAFLERAGLAVERVGSCEGVVHGVDLIVACFVPYDSRRQGWLSDAEAELAQVDLIGPRLLRHGALCAQRMTVVSDPADYARVLKALGQESALQPLRRELAAKALQKTGQQDWAVASLLERGGDVPDLGALSGFPKRYQMNLMQSALFPHGENPHQQAALYGDFFDCLKQLQGSPLGYAEVLDVSAAVYLIGEFERGAVAVLRHATPWSVASSDDLDAAWKHVLQQAGEAALGGVAITNRTVDIERARELVRAPFAAVVAPYITEDALDFLRENQDLRLFMVKDMLRAESLREVRSVVGGIVYQDRDKMRPNPAGWVVAGAHQPNSDDWAGVGFAWRVAKHVRSSAVVLARGEQTLVVAAGFVSCAESLKWACSYAKEHNMDLEGAVVVADDAIANAGALEQAAKSGLSAILCPGKNGANADLVGAADRAGISLILSGTQHIKH